MSINWFPGHMHKARKEIAKTMDEVDVVIEVLDARLPQSSENPLVDKLRKGKPVIKLLNKADLADPLLTQEWLEFFNGMEAVQALALDYENKKLIKRLPDLCKQLVPSRANAGRPVRAMIMGIPNVGKSTLINRLLGFERSVVDAKAGTTRDALDTPFDLLGQSAILIDTAGIRRKARIDDRIERFSVNRSLGAVDRGDLVIHVIDGPEGVTDQDAQILAYAIQRGKALLLAVNKWDLVARNDGDVKRYREEVKYRLAFLDFAPIAFISAATGQGVRKMLQTAVRVLQAYGRKVSTSALNQALQQIVRAHSAPLAQGRAVKFYYGTQTGTRPPTFALFVNRPAAVPESYQTYLVHQLREKLGFEDTPIRLRLRARREEKTGRS